MANQIAEMLTPPPRSIGKIKTLFLNIITILQGLGLAVFGPTLLDLTDLLQTKLSYLSFLFALRSVGGIIGSLTGKVIRIKFIYFVSSNSYFTPSN